MTAATTEARTEGRRQGIREAMTKCAEWFGTPDADDIAHILHGRIEALLDTDAPEPVVPVEEPTPAQLHSACLSFRHDYGLLDDWHQKEIETACKEWWRCIVRALAGEDQA